jgi:hypothetical protein
MQYNPKIDQMLINILYLQFMLENCVNLIMMILIKLN